MKWEADRQTLGIGQTLLTHLQGLFESSPPEDLHSAREPGYHITGHVGCAVGHGLDLDRLQDTVPNVYLTQLAHESLSSVKAPAHNILWKPSSAIKTASATTTSLKVIIPLSGGRESVQLWMNFYLICITAFFLVNDATTFVCTGALFSEDALYIQHTKTVSDQPKCGFHVSGQFSGQFGTHCTRLPAPAPGWWLPLVWWGATPPGCLQFPASPRLGKPPTGHLEWSTRCRCGATSRHVPPRAAGQPGVRVRFILM